MRFHWRDFWGGWRAMGVPQSTPQEQFYRGRSVVATEWWLDDCRLPQLHWARLQVFDNATADVCFGEGETVYGFASREDATNFLSEDEYISLAGWDWEDEQEYGVRFSEIAPPTWDDSKEQQFRYLGTY